MDITCGLFIKPTTFMYVTSLLLLDLNFRSVGGQLQVKKESPDFDGRAEKFTKLYCKVDGPSEKTYEWYHNGSLINAQYFLPGFSSINSDTLTVYLWRADLRYEGSYQLFVSSAFGRIFCRRIKVMFRILGEFVNVTLSDIRAVVKGQPYHLKCPKHSYTRGCFYKWGRNGAFGMKHIREDIHRVILPGGTLFFSALTDQDIEEFGWKGGGYHCMLDCVLPGKKTVMRTSHAISLNQTAVNSTNFGPKIVTIINDREVLLGSKYVRVTCAAAGSPAPSYRWARIHTNGSVVDIKKSKDVEFEDSHHTMIIHGIDKKHNGTYACISTIGTIQDRVEWKLIVREKPTWLPSGMIVSKAVDVFTNFSWQCKAYGDPSPTFVWYSNASEMDTKSERYEIIGGRISFSRVIVEDSGMYQCVAQNEFGSIYQTVALHVRARKPEFNETDANAAFLNNTKGTLRCQSNAIPRANYTWTKNGIPIIPGTKYDVIDGNILVINGMTGKDRGEYKCIAENVFGKAEKVINVTIEDIRFVVKPTSKDNITKGSSFSLFCGVKSSRQVNYTWRFNGQDLKYDDNHIWYERDNRLLVQNANESNSGQYECIAFISKPAHVQRSVTASVLVTGPPNILEGLHVYGKCDNFSAILRWDILPKYNNSATLVIIEWRTSYDPADRWYRAPVKVDANVGQAKVNNLSTWSKVKFRAITQNIYGDGPASEQTNFENCVTSSTRPVKCPENIQIVNDVLGVIDIKWKAMTIIDFNGPGFNYVVKYKHSTDSTWTKTVLDRIKEKFTIPNAETNQLWYFTLQANNSEGLGPMCLENSTHTGQSRPGSISKLMIKEVGTSSVLITWSPPLSNLWSIDGYKLEYGEVGTITSRKKRAACLDISNSPCSTLSLDGESVNYTLDGLNTQTQYNISLRAFNSEGNGPPTYSVFQTKSLSFGETRGSPIYKRNWFITIISVIVLLMFIILFIIFVLNIRRSDRYLVRKRERKKGGLESLYDCRNYDPDPYRLYPSTSVSPPGNKRAKPKPSVYVSNGSTLATDGVSLALSTEDKYDDDGSFVGEYSDKTSSPKYEEMFV